MRAYIYAFLSYGVRMNRDFKTYIYLGLWVGTLLAVGYLERIITSDNIGAWYAGLNRSPLTPPDHVFGIVWSILYVLIAISGWMIWNLQSDLVSAGLKRLFVAQLVLNWSWTPLFFAMHKVYLALLCIIILVWCVAALILRAYPKLKMVSYLLLPYLIWIVFATYLNFYIWVYNL